MRARSPHVPSGPSDVDATSHSSHRWVWVVSATCLLALGAGAAIGYSLTRDTHVGRGETGNAHAPVTGTHAEPEGQAQTLA